MRRHAGGILLDVEDEFGANQGGAQRHLDAIIEAAFGPRVLVKLQRRVQIRFRDGPAISAPGKIGQIAARAFERMIAGRMAAEEHVAVAF